MSMLGGRLGVALTSVRTYGNAVTFVGTTLQAVLSAVEGDSHYRYLAKPQLKVIDGERARLTVGQDVPTRGQTIITNGQTTQGVEYKTAGVMIDLEPRILERSTLLRIKQTVSDVQNTTTSGIDSPTITKREAQTVVEAGDGELILIAGLDSAKVSQSQSGLSFLPESMRSSTDISSDTQLVLILEAERVARQGGVVLAAH